MASELDLTSFLMSSVLSTEAIAVLVGLMVIILAVSRTKAFEHTISY